MNPGGLFFLILPVFPTNSFLEHQSGEESDLCNPHGSTPVWRSDPGPCDPAAANGEFKQIDFTGSGVIKSADDILFPLQDRYKFSVHIEDLGEPGNKLRGIDLRQLTCPVDGSSGAAANCGCQDFYRFTIFDEAGASIYSVSGYLTGGNFQIHRPTGFDLK